MSPQNRQAVEIALANPGLSMDPLTGNRYALAAGNPVSFVEVDGHMVAHIGFYKKVPRK